MAHQAALQRHRLGVADPDERERDAALAVGHSQRAAGGDQRGLQRLDGICRPVGDGDAAADAYRRSCQIAPLLRDCRFWMASPMSVSDSTVRNSAPPGTSTG